MAKENEKDARVPDEDELSSRIRTALARHIAAYRKDRKMSRAELAKKIGVAEMTIGQYERGERTPSVETTYKLSWALRVNIDWLISGNNAARQEDFMFLLKLGLPAEELDDGTVVVYSHSELVTPGDNGRIIGRVLNEKSQTIKFKKKPDVIARFKNFQELHFCLVPLKEMFLNALGTRYYANKYFAELMTKEEIEIPELILLEKNAIGELPPIETVGKK